MDALNLPIDGEARNTVEFLTEAVNQTSPDDSQNSDASQKLSVPSVPIDEHGEDSIESGERRLNRWLRL